MGRADSVSSGILDSAGRTRRPTTEEIARASERLGSVRPFNRSSTRETSKPVREAISSRGMGIVPRARSTARLNRSDSIDLRNSFQARGDIGGSWVAVSPSGVVSFQIPPKSACGSVPRALASFGIMSNPGMLLPRSQAETVVKCTPIRLASS